MNLDHLYSLMADKWKMILDENDLVQMINHGCHDRRLYILYLSQTYHYASHNAKNQAIVVQNINQTTSREINYMKFCLQHAHEETGHEMMAFHDLKLAGLQIPIDKIPKAMSSTESFIAYLYYISQNGNPIRRLGYSFWAENSYKYFSECMQKAAIQMNLNKSMMTFFNEHSDIDQQHALDVEKMIISVCKTDQDFSDISEVMLQTLELTHHMLNEIAKEYKNVLENKSVWNNIFNLYGNPTILNSHAL